MKLPESIPFLCLLSRVCTSSLLRMDELGEEKNPCKVSGIACSPSLCLLLLETICILTLISIIIGFMLCNPKKKIIYQMHMWNEWGLFEKTCLCICSWHIAWSIGMSSHSPGTCWGGTPRVLTPGTVGLSFTPTCRNINA